MSSKKTFSVNIYLDKRNRYKDGTLPVKLRIYDYNTKVEKYYLTKFKLTETQFEEVMNAVRPRPQHKQIRIELQELENEAYRIAKEIEPFDIQKFEKVFLRNEADGSRVEWHYQQVINECLEAERIGTAESYRLSLESLKKYYASISRKAFSKVTLQEISPTWLEGYEKYYTKQGYSLTTIGIYLRALRAVFNRAIQLGDISSDCYPFGRYKYLIPSPRKVKKAISQTDLKKLFEAKPESEGQKRAIEFWFFSYSCNGANPADILRWKYKDIEGDFITFVRQKTKRTSKTSLKPVRVYLNDFAKDYIEKYGNPDRNPENYVFDVINDHMNEIQKRKKIKNFIRNINRRLENLAKAQGLNFDISTIWARHSFCTNAVRKGKSLEFVKDAVGHTDIKTTLNYYAGFDDDSIKDFSNSLLQFD